MASKASLENALRTEVMEVIINALCDHFDLDPDKQIAVIKSSICTGEQVAGFKSKEDGHFTEVMLIRDDRDLAKFKETYKLEYIKKDKSPEGNDIDDDTRRSERPCYSPQQLFISA